MPTAAAVGCCYQHGSCNDVFAKSRLQMHASSQVRWMHDKEPARVNGSTPMHSNTARQPDWLAGSSKSLHGYPLRQRHIISLAFFELTREDEEKVCLPVLFVRCSLLSLKFKLSFGDDDDGCLLLACKTQWNQQTNDCCCRYCWNDGRWWYMQIWTKCANAYALLCSALLGSVQH